VDRLDCAYYYGRDGARKALRTADAYLLNHATQKWDIDLLDYFRVKAFCLLDSTRQAEAIVTRLHSELTNCDSENRVASARMTLLMAQGRLDSALSVVRAWEDRGSPSGISDMARTELKAKCLKGLGRLDEAEKELGETLAIYRGWPMGHFIRAQVLDELGRRDEALAEITECLRLWKFADTAFPELQEARARLKSLGG
jgi:tetratricopeptide (TPR) repeat protein